MVYVMTKMTQGIATDIVYTIEKAILMSNLGLSGFHHHCLLQQVWKRDISPRMVVCCLSLNNQGVLFPVCLGTLHNPSTSPRIE